MTSISKQLKELNDVETESCPEYEGFHDHEEKKSKMQIKGF